MGDTKYAYAVARIRSLENVLFSDTTMEQLLACDSYEQCLQFLTDKGWGDNQTEPSADAILNIEEERTWDVMRELGVDMSVFDVLSYPNLFHNLKAAIKEVCTETDNPNIFYEDCEIDGKEMLEIIREKDFDRLPDNMKEVAKEAYDTLLHTRDGQLCDIMIDQAALTAVYEAGKKSEDDIIKTYAESTVAIADIKIAVRSHQTGKSLDFMRRAMAKCDSLDIEKLAKSALASHEALEEYLLSTEYAEGAEALRESPSAFERWCDNRLIESIKPQKYNPFSVGPLVAYVLARQNEIKTVRIILSGKQNEFSDDAIRERVREMYV